MKISRADVQKIISVISDFLKIQYVPFLIENLDEALYKAVDDEVKQEIHSVLTKFSDPFQNYSTEKKRLSIYKKTTVIHPSSEM